MAVYAKAGEWRFADSGSGDAREMNEQYHPDLYDLDDSTLEAIRKDLAGTDETRWAEVPIKPHHAGFGMWQADRTAAEYEWGDAETLILEIRSNISAEVYELGKDELPPEVEDIRGSVYEEPDRILAYVDGDGHVWYVGVDSRVNHTDDERFVVLLEDADSETPTWVGVDLDDLKPIRPGRPEIGPKIEVRLPEDLLAQIDARAEAKRVTRAEMIRELLAKALDQQATAKARLRWEHTVYCDGRGGEYPAILIRWQDVKTFLGELHNGDPEQDERLVDGLLAAGAPDWVREAPGWVDENGWGLYSMGEEA